MVKNIAELPEFIATVKEVSEVIAYTSVQMGTHQSKYEMDSSLYKTDVATQTLSILKNSAETPVDSISHTMPALMGMLKVIDYCAFQMRAHQSQYEQDASIEKMLQSVQTFAVLSDNPAPSVTPVLPPEPPEPQIPIKMRRSLLGALIGESKRPVKETDSWDLYDRLIG